MGNVEKLIQPSIHNPQITLKKYNFRVNAERDATLSVQKNHFS